MTALLNCKDDIRLSTRIIENEVNFSSAYPIHKILLRRLLAAENYLVTGLTNGVTYFFY